MKQNQQKALELMRADSRRDMYQAVDGRVYITYTGDVKDHPQLTVKDAEEMADAGLITKKWPDCNCWELAG